MAMMYRDVGEDLEMRRQRRDAQGHTHTHAQAHKRTTDDASRERDKDNRYPCHLTCHLALQHSQLP